MGSLEKTLSIARTIREALEPISTREEDEGMQGWCGRASAQLLRETQAAGIFCVEACSNDAHAFNIYRGRKHRVLIDITATQFGIKERVFVRRLVGRRREFHAVEIRTTDPGQVEFVYGDELERDTRSVRRQQRIQQRAQK